MNEQMEVVFVVTDTGVGIPEALKPQLFGQFVQNSNASKTYGGTGLGLSIAKTLTEAMNGTIGFESTEGVGSSFVVKLPLKLMPREVERSENMIEKSSARLDQKRYAGTLMIVEDDHWNAMLLKELLQDRVKKIHVFHRAQEALRYLAQLEQLPDLIFSDIKMPDMDGTTLLSHMRQLDIQIPVVALTAHFQPHKLTALLEMGFTEVCAKPYRIDQILELLERYLPPANTPQKPDVEAIRQFSGPDDEAYQKMLKAFVENNQRQTEIFRRALQEKNVSMLAEISHQMRTSYDLIGKSDLSEALTSIELYEERGLTGRALEEAELLWPLLEGVLTELKTRQSPIPYFSNLA